MSNTPAARNFAHQTIWTADNLPVMRGMNSETVDLIYLDPPFNSNANYAAPIGSQAAGAEFKDTWGLDEINIAWHGLIKHEHPGLYNLLNAVREIRGDSMMAYLIYMAPRLMEAHRLLKPTGSIFLHCDPHASHYLKAIMDTVFGQENMQNEIIWSYRSGGATKRRFSRKHDTLFFYSKTRKYTFHQQKEKSYTKRKDVTRPGVYKEQSTTAEFFEDDQGLYKEVNMRDVWEIPFIPTGSSERIGYPTQKPLRLLNRIINAASNPKDLVLDPFCGCATACVSAELNNREWVGIDIAPKAAELVKVRLSDELKLHTQGVIHRTDIPSRTDLGQLPSYNNASTKSLLYGEQKGYCNLCGTHFELRNLTFDHIVPISRGGTDHISNLQLLCGACNSTKGARSQEWALARLLDKGYIVQQVRNGHVTNG